ncbi:HAMP domain-containing sensor histidine kinase [Variovorax sp. YR752]|uniref:HAMP domain-containing sensor histidine kinase n=1 Tax=Variovorax sp. YR752 TaxID=1884383 RepID=UPI003137E500
MKRWKEAHKRWRHSLRWRLVTLFLLLALATTAVFMFGTQRALQSGWQGWVKPIIADYADRLVAEIGSPPDPARAAAIVARLPVTIRIDGPQVQYDSHPRDESLRERRFDPTHWGLVRSSADGHRIGFGLAGPSPESRPRLFGWFTLAGLLLLTALAYAYVRHLLRPLEAIGEGVARFGRGEFGQPIVTAHNDELADLAERINRMAGSLQGMLDAKRALLLAISHELRSPLTRARVNAELVPEGEHRDALLRDLGEMRDLITDLLESERLAAGHAALQTERVDLAALAHELAEASFAGRDLRFDIAEALAPVTADPTRLRLLLRNLIDNALRHSAGAAEAPTVFLSRGDDGMLTLGVRDHGPGVSDEQLQRLAEPFYRADSARTRSAGGVGLGLYLCRLVAQAHGGELRIERAVPGLRVAMRWRPVDQNAGPSNRKDTR